MTASTAEKMFFRMTILALAFLGSSFFLPAMAKSATSVLGIFEGITPCSAVNRPAPQIAADAQCEMMIWHLTLNQDPDTAVPTTYLLRARYGMSQAGTTGTRADATSLVLDGTWTITHGTTANPDAIVYQLNPADPASSLYFVKVDDNLLHVLSPDKRMLVGNGAWSYTLNRTGDKLPTTAITTTASAALPSTVGTGSPLVGVFEGRTPCVEIVYEFTKVTPSAACQKVKWRLYLYQDPATGAPTTYQFDGTHTSREGTWTVTRGAAADPHALVYQLRLDDSARIVSFLKPDDNHLMLLDADLNLMVGDRLWSYTFSRAAYK